MYKRIALIQGMKPQAEGLKILETRFIMNVKLQKKDNILCGCQGVSREKDKEQG